MDIEERRAPDIPGRDVGEGLPDENPQGTPTDTGTPKPGVQQEKENETTPPATPSGGTNP